MLLIILSYVVLQDQIPMSLPVLNFLEQDVANIQKLQTLLLTPVVYLLLQVQHLLSLIIISLRNVKKFLNLLIALVKVAVISIAVMN